MTVEELYAEVTSDPARAEAWWTLANQLSREGRCAEAAKAWRKVGELPDAHHRGPALYNAGNEYLRAGEHALAVEMYERAVDHDFEDTAGLVHNLAVTLAGARGAVPAAEQDRRDAQARVEPRLRTADQWADFAAFIESRAGDRARAARAYERAIQLEPDANGGDWWLNLAEQRLATGDVDGAGAAWDAARALGSPGWARVERVLALRQGRAEALLQRWTVEENPRRQGQLLALLFGMGRSAEGLRFAQERLASGSLSESHRIDLLLELANEALRRGDAPEALRRLDQLNGKPQAATLLRARALHDLARVDEALQVLERSSKLGALAPVETACSSRTDTWWTLAKELSREGRFEEAAKAWQKVGESPKAHHRGPAYYNAGNECLRSRDHELALEMYDRALDHDFDDVAEVIHNVALALADCRGEHPAAEQDRRAAQDRAEARLRTAQQWGALAEYIAARSGDRPRAARAFQRAIALDEDANGGEWWIQLADQRILLGDALEAASAWQNGIALGHPGCPSVERAIAVRQGTGASLLERWVGDLSGDGTLRDEIPRLLFELERPAEAAQYVEERLASPSLYVSDRVTLVVVLAEEALRRGDPAEALRRVSQLPGNPQSTAWLRARALFDAGRVDEALQVLEPSSQLGALAPVEDRLLLAKCRTAKGLPVDRTLVDEVNPLPEWWSQ